MTDHAWNGPFVPGLKYSVTVEACNRADMCTIRSSDGLVVDNSPPIRGIVYVGPGNGHNKYLSQRSSIQIRWDEFEDPHSSIDHYEVCVSTINGVCDVVKRSNVLFHSNIFKSNITLPTNDPLTATVWATNGVGMWVSQVSDTFIIDDIPPIVKEAPQFKNIQTVQGQHYQWDKSIIKLQWHFSDDISPIIRHEISLKTHHDGHTPVEHVVLGSERTLSISLDGNNWLHSGDTYYAIVTACNAAGLCTSERTNDLLIDSTPPHLGGFNEPLFWTEYKNAYGHIYSNLTLTWYGFYDPESRVEKYFITVSRKYSDTELSEGVFTVLASNDTKLDMQSTLGLSELLSPGESIILSFGHKIVLDLIAPPQE
ncbi:uncharacterized protein LOC127858901 [Dreissena polymorpha]|nr:uncharacterized protein LOC127858901 [Dreissena polymorpha]